MHIKAAHLPSRDIPLKTLSMHYMTVDRFFAGAADLRKVFDRRFERPLETRSDRFVWDYWHVPGEYTQLRTPAFHYFPKELYARFHRHLVRWGRENLGCHDISPPWLSCYVEGCRQEAHRDVPHGPLAFVFSLTKWEKRRFKGGETFIEKPRLLIEPKFNRLTLFNPSLSHGVKQVRGTHDPREGRLVINGWFVNPRPFWVGEFTPKQVQEALDEGLSRLDLGGLEPGFASFRLKIKASGDVAHVRPLVDTFASGAPVKRLARHLLTLKFEKTSRPSQLTFPLRID